MDACIKQGLRHFYSNVAYGQTDVPQIALELLISTCKSDFPNQRSYTQWLKRQVLPNCFSCSPCVVCPFNYNAFFFSYDFQANILEELLPGSDDFVADEHTVLSMLLSQLKNVEACSFFNCLYFGHILKMIFCTSL